MKKVLFGLAITGIAVLTACTEEDPKPNPIIGLWELDEAMYSDAPSNFSNVEGTYTDRYGEDGYTISFYKDGEYDREFDGDPYVENDEGIWEVFDDVLELDPDGSKDSYSDYEFTIVEEISDREMILSSNSTVGALDDDIYPQWAQWAQTGSCGCELDTITTQEGYIWFLNNFVHEIQITVTYEFDRIQ